MVWALRATNGRRLLLPLALFGTLVLATGTAYAASPGFATVCRFMIGHICNM